MSEVPSNPSHSEFRASQPEAKDDREPFIVRGHHVPSLVGLTKFPRNNSFVITAGMKFMKFQGERMRNKIIKSESPNEEQQELLMRLNDYMGTAQDGAKKYTENMVEIYKTFIKLPDDYPVKLVSGQKDAICQACIVGEHCDMQFREKFGASNANISGVSIRDKFFVDQLLENAKALNIDDKNFKTTTERATFSDAPPQLVESITTTAGIFKKILKESKFKKFK